MSALILFLNLKYEILGNRISKVEIKKPRTGILDFHLLTPVNFWKYGVGYNFDSIIGLPP